MTAWGTWYALKQFNRPVPEWDPATAVSVSILKPLKGLEDGLEENLETFFTLDYPRYEILFSIADPHDPARNLIEKLQKRYSQIPTRLILGCVNAGPNPKVNNLILSYEQANNDHLLISDSNVRVAPDYLKRLAPLLTSQVGIVTAIVAGKFASGVGGWLESIYLNTFYARWMHVASAMRHPTVVGKSMFFRRSTAERFGGMMNLSRYIAEDYMAGQAMQRLGLEVVIMPDPIDQYIGFHRFSTFWSRHLRWGRIRKSQAPAVFFLEPFLSCAFSGVAGAIAFSRLGILGGLLFLAFHLSIWSFFDLLMVRRLEGHLKLHHVVGWFLRELLALPQWVHMACGNTVNWRGNRLKISSGGLLTSIKMN